MLFEKKKSLFFLIFERVRRNKKIWLQDKICFELKVIPFLCALWKCKMLFCTIVKLFTTPRLSGVLLYSQIDGPVKDEK